MLKEPCRKYTASSAERLLQVDPVARIKANTSNNEKSYRRCKMTF